MNKILLTLIFTASFFLQNSLLAQVVTTTTIYNSDTYEVPIKIQHFPNEGFYIGGNFSTNNNSVAFIDFFIAKFDETTKELLWKKTYGDTFLHDAVRDFVITPDSNLLVLIDQSPPVDQPMNNGDFTLMKLDTAGNILWETLFDNGYTDSGSELVITDDGRYVVLGVTSTTAGNSNPFFLWTEFDSDGNLINTLTDNTFEVGSNQEMVAAPDGGFYALSKFESVIKLNAQGNIIWEKDFSNLTTGYFTFKDILVKPDGTLLVSGDVSEFIPVETADGFIMALNAEGEFLWQKLYGGEGIDQLENIIYLEATNEIMAAGMNFEVDGFLGTRFYFLITDSLGNETFSTIYSADHNFFFGGQAIDLIALPDGEILSIGFTQEVNGTRDIIMMTATCDSCLWSEMSTSIDSPISNPLISVFPNPASEYLMINIEEYSQNDKVTFTLYDVLGRTIFMTEINSSQEEINLSKISSGSYFYKINSDNLLVKSGKLILK